MTTQVWFVAGKIRLS